MNLFRVKFSVLTQRHLKALVLKFLKFFPGFKSGRGNENISIFHYREDHVLIYRQRSFSVQKISYFISLVEFIRYPFD